MGNPARRDSGWEGGGAALAPLWREAEVSQEARRHSQQGIFTMGGIGHGDAPKSILQIGKMMAGHIESVWPRYQATRQ